jgi:hypothetical protein
MEAGMGERNRRRAAPAASLKQSFGGGELELHLFPLAAVVGPPRSAEELPLAMWRLQVGKEMLERKAAGDLYCACCDDPILGLPPILGFVKQAARAGKLAGIAVCGTCLESAGSSEALTDMVTEAIDCEAAPIRWT